MKTRQISKDEHDSLTNHFIKIGGCSHWLWFSKNNISKPKLCEEHVKMENHMTEWNSRSETKRAFVGVCAPRRMMILIIFISFQKSLFKYLFTTGFKIWCLYTLKRSIQGLIYNLENGGEGMLNMPPIPLNLTSWSEPWSKRPGTPAQNSSSLAWDSSFPTWNSSTSSLNLSPIMEGGC